MKNKLVCMLTILLLLYLSSTCTMPDNEDYNQTRAATGTIAPPPPVDVTSNHPAVYEARLTNNNAGSSEPSLVWTGIEYGVAWVDGRDADYGTGNTEVYFARISKFGAKIGTDINLTNSSSISRSPSLVWDNEHDNYAVAWDDTEDGVTAIYFALLDSKGQKIAGSEKRITDTDSNAWDPSLVWTGSEYGLAWIDFRNTGDGQIYFARLNSSGNKITNSEKAITHNDSNCNNPSLVWADNEYGVAWEDYRPINNYEVYFARIDNAGIISPPGEIIISEGNISGRSTDPVLVWTGSEYGMAWSYNHSAGDIKFARINSDGQKIDPPGIINAMPASGSKLSLTWTGSNYGIAYEAQSDIYFITINESGSEAGTEVRISTDSDHQSTEPSLIWNGNQYGLAWADWRDGNAEIYFSRLDISGNKYQQGGVTGTLDGKLDGYYYIRNNVYGTYLTHYLNTHKLGLNLYAELNGIRQTWRFAESSGHPGWYKIISSGGRRIVGNPPDNELILQSGGGGSPVLWKLYDRENDGRYLLRSKVNISYRIFAASKSSVELSKNWRNSKLFEIIPAAY